MIMVNKIAIKNRIAQDLRKINPDKIILFGSLVHNTFVENKSDIDLLIIKDTNDRLADRYSQARLSLTLDLPFDIFVLSQKELDEKLKSSFFFREILERGEIIYDKND
jgi:predicted nucleotidyltransferase